MTVAIDLPPMNDEPALHRPAGPLAGAGLRFGGRLVAFSGPDGIDRPRRGAAHDRLRYADAGGTSSDGTSSVGSWSDAEAGTKGATAPRLSIGNAAVAEGDPVVTGRPITGPLSTRGNQIVDATGAVAKIAGVNWFGAESTRYAPDGLHVRGYKEMMDQMVRLGFNSIRLPYSDSIFLSSSVPNGIDFSKNPDLEGLNGLQIIDKVVAYAGKIGLRVLLDHHRSTAGAGASENGLWYNDQFPEATWIANWKKLALRYKGNPTVIGADLHNEPHAGTWGGGGDKDWAAAAERAGNAILAVNPNWLIVVEGVAAYDGEYYWWGGNLAGARDRPIRLSRTGRLVYSAHDYPNSVYPQSWFSDANFPRNLPAKFDAYWGYLYRNNVAPVLLGEFGSRLEDAKDRGWFDTITAYIGGDFNNDGRRDISTAVQGMSWTWWSWNPNSSDTGGILADDWTTPIPAKLAGLKPLMFDWTRTTTAAGTTPMRFTVRLSKRADKTVTVGYRTEPATAVAGDFTPVSGKLVFQPGATKRTITVNVRGDAAAEPDEQFRLVLSKPKNARMKRARATGLIRNDD